MEKLAIDVVLLPPPEMARQAIAVSNKLAEASGKTTILLDGDSYLPHISLCMGAVSKEDLPNVYSILNDIANDTNALSLTVPSIKTHDIPTGERLAVLEVTNSPSLQELHETIMARLRSYLSYDDIETSMFFSPPDAAPISVKWVRDFDQSQPHRRPYYPHITCGFSGYDDFAFPFNFVANNLAVCHLGNYCTCRKVLQSFNLH